MKKTGKNMMKLTIVILIATIIVLVGIIVNILNTNNTINKQEEAGVEQLTQTASSNAYIDMETHLSEVSNSASSVKKAVVFTSSPVDMTQYTDRWAELTTADFKVGFGGVQASAEGKRINNSGCSTSAYSGPKYSYNNTTGVLTFNSSVSASQRKEQASDQYVIATVYGTGQFVVWLGTVGGE